MIIKRRIRERMVGRRRYLFSFALFAMMGVGVLTGYQTYVAAEDPNDYETIFNFSNWNLRGETPDPALNWVYNESGRTAEGIEHVLKNEDSSDIRQINLKLYFDSQPTQPISITSRAPYCDLSADPALGNFLSMRVGGVQTYYSAAHREGLYSASREYKAFAFTNRIDDDVNANGSTNPNARWDWKLEHNPEKDKVFQANTIRSRICDYDPDRGPDYEKVRFVEQCTENWKPAKQACDHNGSEFFKEEDVINTLNANDPGPICANSGCEFGGYVHTVPADRAQQDAITGKWFVDVQVELGGAANSEELLAGYSGTPTGGYENKQYKKVLQQIRFRLETSSGGKFGYGNPTAAYGFDQQFGIGAGQSGGDNDPEGVKFAVPFGVPCDQPSGGGLQRISLYDIDSTRFGPSYIKVFQRDPEGPGYPNNVQASPLEAYSLAGLQNASRQDTMVRMKLADGANGTGSFLFDMKFGIQYVALVINPKGGPKSPINNVFSLNVPNETVYGIENCKYNLTPTINDIGPTFESSPSIFVKGDINDNDRAPGGNHEWSVSKIVFDRRPSDMHASQQDNLANGCGHMTLGNSGSGPRNCEVLNPGSSYPSTNSYQRQFTDSAPYPVGSYVCFVTSIKRPQWNLDTNLWRHSSMKCSVSIKKPRVQFLGSDLRAGGTAISNYSTINGSSYGSWVEYGVFSLNRNTTVGSGNGLRNGPAASPTSPRDWNRLTFTNNSSEYGNFDAMPASYSAYTYFNGLPVTADGSDLNAATQANGVYDMSGVSLGNTLQVDGKGQSVILKINGNFKINKDIIVGPISGIQKYANVNEISQVVIVADSIDIADNVERVDAWLVTPALTGSVNTCWINNGGSQDLNSKVCDKPLTVNGPVYTAKLKLRRTGGSNSPPVEDLKKAAEVFNLRPDAQLWSYAYANKADYAQTDFIQELPPRY